MRGHIVKRAKDSYSIVISLGTDPATGKRLRQWVSIKGNKKDAERKLAEMLHQIDTGYFVEPNNITVAEYFEKWLEGYKNSLSPRGYERYRDIIRKGVIPMLGKTKLMLLKPEHLKQYYSYCQNRGLSIGSIRYHHAVIHVALKAAVKTGLVGRNIADAVDVPRIRRSEMTIWDEDEISKFLEKAKDSSYYAMFYTFLFTGMRRSELLGLKWSDVDLLMSQIHVNRGLHHLKDGSYVLTEPKSAKSRRTIALSPSVTSLLRDHQTKQKLECIMLEIKFEDDRYVFTNHDGKPFRPNTITRAWETMAKKANIKVIRLHDARHTHASLMLKKGIHPKIVQERLGHSSIEMTLDIYSHVVPGLQEAAALRFDEMIVSKLQNVNTREKV
jgi:integrase